MRYSLGFSPSGREGPDLTLTGAELRRLRRAAGLTQAALAARAGVHRETVGYWEAKAEPLPCRWGAVRRFLGAMGIAPDLSPPSEAVAWAACQGAPATPDTRPHSLACIGKPKTQTGRVVALEEWRRLSAWERDGPGGLHWDGITRQWKEPG